MPADDVITMAKAVSKFYYWLSFVTQFAISFVLLMTLNCVIVDTLCKRSNFITKENVQSETQDQGQREVHASKVKFSEAEIYVILLL